MKLSIASQTLSFKLIFFTLATFLAVVFGFIAITANPILIGLAIGAIFGLFLLAIPKKTIWLVIVLGLATPALFDMAGHSLSRVSWSVSMLALLLLLPGFINLFNFNPEHKKLTPAFIWLAVFFMFFAVFSTTFQFYSFGELIGGFKRYFQILGLMIALATMPHTKKDFDGWLKLLLVIALFQLPFALFERFILVPMRGGIELGGGQATDIVAGTMGANLEGGSPNSIMVVFVLLAFSFIFSRWKEKLITTSHMLLLGFVLLAPLVLGESKVVVVLLPLTSLVLLRKEIIYNPVKYLPIFIGSIVLTIVFAYVYVYLMLDSNFTDAIKGTLLYNVKDIGYGTSLLNRTTVMSFWWDLHGWHDPIPLLFGHGLGSSYGQGLDAGHVAQMYPNYGIGLTAISTILWDLGFVGLVLYISIFIVTWFQISKVWKFTSNSRVRADCLSIQAGIALTMFFMIYSDSQVNLMVHEITIAVLLGYAAFLYREHYSELGFAINQNKIR
jgi:hypothetical protein